MGRVAARLAAFADASGAWQAPASQRPIPQKAAPWMKDNEIVLKNERVNPVAAEIPSASGRELRRETALRIAGLTLRKFQRGVASPSPPEVDGEGCRRASGSDVVRGELRSLALALFLPRCGFDARDRSKVRRARMTGARRWTRPRSTVWLAVLLDPPTAAVR